MNTVKVIVIVAGIAILGLLAGWGIKTLRGGANTQIADQTQKTGNAELDLPVDTNQFAWGITVLTFPFPTYQQAFIGTQIKEAKKLGINYIRVDYAPGNPKAVDEAVNQANANSLRVVLVIPFGPKDIYTNKNLKADTEHYVSDIVTRYKGKVAIYQLATEVASVALNNNAGAHGIEKKDYPADKLAAVTTWVKTASETVKKTDPTAKRLVNDQWVHTGFFDNFFASGGDFDILGWNWFSDMGTSMEKVVLDSKTGQSYELLKKIQGYNKPIWLTEVNRRLGSQGGKEKEQADFIKTMASYATKQSAIKGFFVFNLLEDQAASPQERGYSIITATDNGKIQTITGHKAAFDAYKSAITQNR